MKRFLAALCATLFLAAGCGQSGPLYIPGNPSKVQAPPPAAESTADEEEAEQNSDTDK